MGLEVFLSPLVPPVEAERVERILNDLSPGFVRVQRISATVGLRIVSMSEIGLIAKTDCVIATPLCIEHMRAIKIGPDRFENGVYANLFLFRRKVALMDMDDASERRMRMMVAAMGGEIGFVLDRTVNVVVTGQNHDVRLPDTRRRHRLVKSDWIEALFTSRTFIEPMRFAAEIVYWEQPKLPRRKPLATPGVELKRIKSDNKGDILRKREKTHDIRKFVTTEKQIDSLCRTLMESTRHCEASQSKVDVDELSTFTQVVTERDIDAPVIGYESGCSQMSPMRVRPENDPLLSLFA